MCVDSVYGASNIGFRAGDGSGGSDNGSGGGNTGRGCRGVVGAHVKGGGCGQESPISTRLLSVDHYILYIVAARNMNRSEVHVSFLPRGPCVKPYLSGNALAQLLFIEGSEMEPERQSKSKTT